jgi:uncharacterized cofD-like protein
MQRAAPHPRNVVAVGGGTGLASLLAGLKTRVGAEIADLAAIVAVSDDGGSSGRLRREFGLPPPGDIRNCLAALADDTDLLTRLFQFRFEGGEGLAGHSFGNLFLAALTELTGDFPQAILTAERVLSVRGRILPATLASVNLRGHADSGHVFEGESLIGRAHERIVRVEMVPPDPPAYQPAVEAIRDADLVLLGPGSLYTSIVPNLLIPVIARALAETRAPIALVLNLMTQPGETDGLGGRAHVEAIADHLGPGILDAVLLHEGAIDEPRLAPYRAEGAETVTMSDATCRDLGVVPVRADLVSSQGLVRHDPDKLARAVVEALPEELGIHPSA